VSEYTRDNLFSAAHGETQIDATFGGAAAVGEMLLGSHGGELRPLQGLPGAWAEGSVSGLRARGGFEVDLTWSDGALDGATVRSETGERCRVRTAEAAVETVECDGGEDPSLDRPEDGVVAFPTEAGHAYRLRTE
jgi:alpha-L-fucosidase 2